MIEIVIDSSTNAEGEATFSWSVWDDDQQIEIARAPHFSIADCESSAVDYCWRSLGFKPDKVTRP